MSLRVNFDNLFRQFDFMKFMALNTLSGPAEFVRNGSMKRISCDMCGYNSQNSSINFRNASRCENLYT
jgi:hypothetical protein